MAELMLIGDGIATVCSDTRDLLGFIGWILTIFKVAIPLIIIVLGLIDLGKVAVSSKPEEVKKSATSLIWRLIGGAVIFFLPSLVMLAFGFVTSFSDATSQMDFDICYECMTSPWSSTCTGE